MALSCLFINSFQLDKGGTVLDTERKCGQAKRQWWKQTGLRGPWGSANLLCEVRGSRTVANSPTLWLDERAVKTGSQQEGQESDRTEQKAERKQTKVWSTFKETGQMGTKSTDQAVVRPPAKTTKGLFSTNTGQLVDPQSLAVVIMSDKTHIYFDEKEIT